jgi:serine/threonine protein kinase
MKDVKELLHKNFGDYRLTEYLGFTGVAHVFRAVDLEKDATAAVHILPDDNVNKPNYMEMYILKAALLQTLKHPNIVPTLSYGVEHGCPYLVMAHVPGPTLRDLLNSVKKRLRRIPVDAAIFIATSIAGAISHAHDKEVAHGALKPTNILLEKSGTVMVTDFGLPFLLTYKPISVASAEETLISEGTSISANKLRDLFDLGIIFYEMITNRHPYPDVDIDPMSVDFSRLEVTPVSAHFPEAPALLDKLVMKLIAPNPHDRYHSTEAVMNDLTALSRRVKTTSLPSAQLSDVAAFSSRFASAVIPEEMSLEPSHKTAIYFMDTGQIVELDDWREYTIGRQYEGQPVLPDIDLTPFKAYEWGISRLHATLKTQPGNVTIIDMNSSNGTYHAGRRLDANVPHQLKHGDIIMLGKLRLQVLMPEI